MSQAGNSPGALEAYQEAVDEVLIRHRSILDVLTKLQEANARLTRAAAKAVTVCGCISIAADRQRIPADAQVSCLHQYVHSHVQGALCGRCREAVSTELGQSLFYETALANLLQLEMPDVLNQELERLRTLGIFTLS